MYKRRIQVLEQKNIQLEKALKTISLNLNPKPFEGVELKTWFVKRIPFHEW